MISRLVIRTFMLSKNQVCSSPSSEKGLNLRSRPLLCAIWSTPTSVGRRLLSRRVTSDRSSLHRSFVSVQVVCTLEKKELTRLNDWTKYKQRVTYCKYHAIACSIMQYVCQYSPKWTRSQETWLDLLVAVMYHLQSSLRSSRNRYQVTLKFSFHLLLLLLTVLLVLVFFGWGRGVWSC